MPRTTSTVTAVALALLATIVGVAHATSGQPPHPVAAGMVQHTVTDVFPPLTRGRPQEHTRIESWISARAGRIINVDAITGRLKSDCAFRLKRPSRCWTRSPTPGRPGVIHVNPWSPNLLFSWVDIGANEKAALGSNMRMVGTTTYLGRPALTFQEMEPTSDGGTSSTTEIVDAKTYYPLREDDVITGPHRSQSSLRTTVMETLPARGVKLTMGRHRGAKVVDDLANAHR